MLTWMLVLRLLRGAGEGASYGTTLILTDRTSTGDGITLSVDRDVSYSFDAADTTGGGIA